MPFRFKPLSRSVAIDLAAASALSIIVLSAIATAAAAQQGTQPTPATPAASPAPSQAQPAAPPSGDKLPPVVIEQKSAPAPAPNQATPKAAGPDPQPAPKQKQAAKPKAAPKQQATTPPPPSPEPAQVDVQTPASPATALGTYNPALDLPGLDLPPGTTLTTAGPVNGYRALSAGSATKSGTPIRQTPQSIAVVPRSVIDDQKPVTAGEVLRNVSGVVINNPLSTPAFDSTRVRGFLSDQWVDGLTTYYSPGDREGTINLERIEVLKGPSGMLYGGGVGTPVGGAVNFVSKLPEDRAFGKFGITFGSHEHVQPFFDVNQPIMPGVLFRITGEYTHAESFVDVIETERYNINPTLTLTNRTDTTLTLQAKLTSWRQPEYQGLPSTGTISGGFRIPRDTFIGPADIEDSHSRYKGATLTFDHKFDSVWSVNVKGRIARSEFEENVQSIVGGDGFGADEPFFPPSTWGLANAELYQEQDERTITGYAKAKFGWGPTSNTLLIGADYSRLKDQGFLNFATIPGGFFDPLFPQPFPPYIDPGPGVNDLFVTTTTAGGFVQMQSSLWERVHLVGGVRLANIELAYTAPGTQAVTDETKALPRIGAVVDITPAISLFASYSEGMRGQPFLTFAGTPQPELSDQIEGGIKFEFNNQLSGTLAVFEVNRQNVATTDPATFLSLTNGEQRARGFEADVVWQPAPAWKLLASYAYTDAEYTKTVPATLFSPAIPAGNKLRSVPEHAGRVWINYAFQDAALSGLSIGTGVYLASERFVNDTNRFKTESFYSVDAKIAYETSRYEAALTVKNLTDQRYFEPYNYFAARVAPSDGITVYGTLAYKY